MAINLVSSSLYIVSLRHRYVAGGAFKYLCEYSSFYEIGIPTTQAQVLQ